MQTNLQNLKYQVLHLLQDMLILQYLQALKSSFLEAEEQRERYLEICMP